MRSKSRCANTVPISAAQAPFRPGSLRVKTPTRASSPIRPGSTAFANSPIEDREEVEADRHHDPLPADDRERVSDPPPVRAPPPEQHRDSGRQGENEGNPQPAVMRERGEVHPAAASVAGDSPV